MPRLPRFPRRLLLGLVLTACAIPSTLAAETLTLEQADQQLNQAARERDRDTFRELLSPDVVFLAGEAQRGRVAVLAIWQHLFDGKYDFRYEAETLETTVADSGELGWAIGSARTSFRRPGMDTDTVTDAHYLNVWKRDGESWKLVHMASLVVHPTLGAARDARSGMMTAWPELADQIGASIDIEWAPTSTVRADSGELAYSVGDYSASFSGEETHAGKGAFLAVWQKDDAGHWQLGGEGFTPPGIYGDSSASP